MPSVMSPNQFVAACKTFTAVSHETIINLTSYAELLTKWQSKINLVSNSTLDDIWLRHIYDSAQLLQFIKPTDSVVDFGSGAGFPAMVLAVMGAKNVTAIESDQRKIVFLNEVARITKTKINLINKRIEDVEVFPVDVISARAFASLTDILQYAQPWWEDTTKGVFLKGSNVKEELTAASAKWHIRSRTEVSRADPNGSVLIIERAEALS